MIRQKNVTQELERIVRSGKKGCAQCCSLICSLIVQLERLYDDVRHGVRSGSLNLDEAKARVEKIMHRLNASTGCDRDMLRPLIALVVEVAEDESSILKQ